MQCYLLTIALRNRLFSWERTQFSQQNYIIVVLLPGSPLGDANLH